MKIWKFNTFLFDMNIVILLNIFWGKFALHYLCFGYLSFIWCKYMITNMQMISGLVWSILVFYGP